MVVNFKMIKIIDGDLFDSKAKIIAHQVNCQGHMGSGVALQVKQKYPHVYEKYKEVCSSDMLGEIQLVSTNKDYLKFTPGSVLNPSKQYICNMFAQNNYGYDGKQYTSVKDLEQCFYKLRNLTYIKNNLFNATIAMSYMIGCCRGGANWNEVYALIEKIFHDCNVELYKYDKG